MAVSVCSLLAGCGGVFKAEQAAYPAEKFAVRSVTVDGVEHKYRVYVPASVAGEKGLPVVLYLHGAGNRGTDNESQLNGLAERIDANADKIKFIMVIPQLPPDRFWDAEELKMADAALDATVKEHDGDRDRLSVMGFSLGGYGTWMMALTNPGKYAAIVPMGARVMPRDGELSKVSQEVADMARSPDNYKLFAKKIGNTAVWAFHGLDDEVVSDAEANQMQDALRSNGNKKATLTMVLRGGHAPLGFDNAELFDWIIAQRRGVE